jgi:hypothetical protein
MAYSGTTFGSADKEKAAAALARLRDENGALIVNGVERDAEYLFGKKSPVPDDRYPDNAAEIAVAKRLHGELAASLASGKANRLTSTQQEDAKTVTGYLEQYFLRGQNTERGAATGR